MQVTIMNLLSGKNIVDGSLAKTDVTPVAAINPMTSRRLIFPGDDMAECMSLTMTVAEHAQFV
jgi:hypothetical protein